jgi:hypothetical protein
MASFMRALAYLRRPEEFASQVCDMYVNRISTRKVKKTLESVARTPFRDHTPSKQRLYTPFQAPTAQLWLVNLFDLTAS